MTRIQHIVADIETLGTRKDAVIFSIGLVAILTWDDGTFTVSKGARWASALGIIEQLSRGRTTSKDTLRFWGGNQIHEAAKRELTYALTDTHPVCDTLGRMNAWIRDVGSDVIVWGKGPSFDNAMLQDILNFYGIEPAWKFRNEGCVRTAMRMLPEYEEAKPTIPHLAIEDAIAEAQTLINIQSKLPPGVRLLNV